MTTMYVVQRKEDGKFWTNQDYHGRICSQYSGVDRRWSTHLSDCRPFRSIGACKNAMKSRTWPHFDPGSSGNLIPYEKRLAMSREIFDDLFTIVPVTIVLVRTDET